jgi:hypothetical protein
MAMKNPAAAGTERKDGKPRIKTMKAKDSLRARAQGLQQPHHGLGIPRGVRGVMKCQGQASRVLRGDNSRSHWYAHYGGGPRPHLHQ